MIIKLWKKLTYRSEDTTDYVSLQRRAGQVMPWWDQRGIPGTRANSVEQPGVGYANDHLRMMDPDWRPR